jgi:hypothetical protein
MVLPPFAMKISSRSCFVTPLLLACGALAATALALGPDHAQAADAAPAAATGSAPPAGPLITLSAEQKTGTFTADNNELTGPKKVTTTKTTNGTKTKTTSVELESVTAGANAQTWVEITVKNLDKKPLAKLAVSYTVYVKSTTEGTSASKITWAAPHGSETITVPATSEVVVKTKPVQKTVSNTASNSESYGGVQSTSTKSAVSDIVGWYVEATYHGQVLQTLPHPDNIQDQYKAATGK